MREFPTVEMVSRDRGSAYAAAAATLGKPQVADGFHLVQNLHQAVKESLAQSLGSDVFVRKGAGWVPKMDGAEEARLEPAPAGETSDRADPLGVVPGPATLTVADRERRIQLAGLTARQATKYRRTLAVLEMTDSGLRTTEIAERLACTMAEVRSVDIGNRPPKPCSPWSKKLTHIINAGSLERSHRPRSRRPPRRDRLPNPLWNPTATPCSACSRPGKPTGRFMRELGKRDLPAVRTRCITI